MDEPVDHEALLRQHLPGLREFLSRRAGALIASKESSADLAQSVCREVLERLERRECSSDEGFRQWLFRTAERKLVDRARYWNARRRDPRREESPDPAEIEALLSTPSHDAIIREDFERARNAFAALPDAYRQVIVLARVEGLDTAAIAARMGKKQGTVRSLLCRGLAMISEAVDESS
ncbi:MAG: sigma-70 family RNA polymerase sigma factor [Planctomycetota bacterium]